jgi:hypothetical protein
MKSKNLITLFFSMLLIFSFSERANSQVLISLLLGDKLNSDKLKFGLDGGANFTTISNIAEAKYRTGFNIGFYFDILLKKEKHWYIHTGVLVKSKMGAKKINPYSLEIEYLDSAFVNGYVDRQISYFNVPILARYKFKNELFIEAGPMLGLRSKANDIFYNKIENKKDLSFKNDVRDQYKRIDAGVMAGMGYHLIKGTGINFGLRYYYGLTDILIDNTGDPQRNSSFYLYASIPVGAGEKAKAKEAAKLKEKEAKKAAKEKK